MQLENASNSIVVKFSLNSTEINPMQLENAPDSIVIKFSLNSTLVKPVHA